MKRAHRPRTWLTALALSLGACAGIETTAHKEDTTDFDVFRTYAWLDQDPSLQRMDPTLVERARAAAAAELEAIGMQATTRREAELLLELRSRVEERVRNRDPYFAADTIERYEDGVLTLTALDPLRMRDLWTGTARAELRTVAHGGGVLVTRFAETGEERVWPIEDMVRSLFDEFPPRTRRRATD